MARHRTSRESNCSSFPSATSLLGQHESAGVSADVRKTARSLEATCVFLDKLDAVTAYVMELLKSIDPVQYAAMEQLYRYRMSRYKAAQALESSSKVRMFFEGREVQFNRFSTPHFDSSDPDWAWAIIVYFGTFPECRMRFRQLRLEVVLRPGDAVAIRGHNVLHEAGDWLNGERHVLVHFTHASMWREAGLECVTGPAAPTI